MMSVPADSSIANSAALALDRICFVRDARRILDDVSLTVTIGQRWLVLGANGSGKSTLLRIAALYEHPTSGTVTVLGEQLGRTDVRSLRRRVGYAAAGLTDALRPELIARDVVKTARYAALEPWWHHYTEEDDRRAERCLDRMGVGSLAGRVFGSLSSGERQRVLLARTLMNDPAVVLLDEPAAGLDLGGRELLVDALADLAADPDNPPFVLVTHHVDEIPPGTTHALLLRDGVALATGPIESALTAESLGECYGLSVELERRADGRYGAWTRRSRPARARRTSSASTASSKPPPHNEPS